MGMSLQEVTEIETYQKVLHRARTMPADNDKECEKFMDDIEHLYKLDLLSSSMVQRVSSILCSRMHQGEK